MAISTCHRLLSLLLFLTPLSRAAQTLTIDDDYPSDSHDCIRKCLFYRGVYDDLGEAIACGTPYENDCYCATATASASAASRWIDDCADERCAAGDLTKDVSIMRGIYATYCAEAGYNQPIISAWYTTDAPEPTSASSSSSSSDDAEEEQGETTTTAADEPTETGSVDAGTTTEVELVTATSTGRGLPDWDNGATDSRVVVQATSTVWLNPEGSAISGPADKSGDGGSGDNKVGLGVGLGVGIPVAISILAVGLWLGLRRRRRNKTIAYANEHALPPSQPPMGESYEQPAGRDSKGVSPVSGGIGRKPVPAPTPPLAEEEKMMELSGQGVTRELSGREIHPFPDNGPSPPVAVPGQYEMPAGNGVHAPANSGQYEMPAENRPYEMAGSQTQRWELPGH